MVDKRKDVAREICRNYNVSLSPQVLDAFAQILFQCKYLRGEKAVRAGEVTDAIFYLERGLVIQHYMKNGMDVTEHISREGDMVINIESFFTRTPSVIEISMQEPSMLYGIPHDELYALAEQHYEICKLIFAIYERSLIISQQKADVLRFESAKERYVRTLKENGDIVRRTPLHNIASLLQMTPETLSRVRGQVQREGLDKE